MEKYTKRLLSLALVAVMVFSMLPDFSFAASAQTETQSQAASPYEGELNLVDGKAVCPVCGGDPVEWLPLTAKQGLQKNKHYYLADDVTDTNSANDTLFNSAWTSGVDNNAGKICVHLNGRNITTSGKYAFAMTTYGGTMNIMGTGTVSSTNWYGAVYLSSAAAIFNIYSGTFVKGDAAGNFPVIRVQTAGAVVNMHGGQIGTPGNTMQHGTAAAVYVNAGSFTLNDGTIYGGTGNNAGSVHVVSGATLTVNGGKITGGKAGTTNCDVYVASGGTFTNNTYVDAIDAVAFADSAYSYSAKCRHCDVAKTWTRMTGAKASNCADGDHLLMAANIASDAQYAAIDVYVDPAKTVCWALNGKTVHTGRTTRAGSKGTLNIMGKGEVIGVDGDNAASHAIGTLAAQWGGKLNLYGGTYSTNNGKPVLYVQGGASQVTVHEGVVFKDNAGTATNLVNVISDAPITMDGVTVNGNMNMGVASTKLVLSGKTTINQLTLVSGSTVDVSGLTAGSDIKVTAPEGVFTKAVPADKAQTIAGYFSIYGNDATKQIAVTEDSKLEVAAVPQSGPKGGYNDPLVFGTDGLAWCPACQNYETWTELKGNATNVVESGTYAHYYLSDDYTSSTTGIRLTNADACLHLNDNTLTSTGGIALQVNATGRTLNVMGRGKITGAVNDAWYGSALYTKGQQVNFYSDVTLTKASTATGPILHADTCEVNLIGNVTIGEEGLTYNGANKAAVTTRGAAVINMQKGTIIGGSNTSGTGYASAFTVYSSAGFEFNMTGGEIRSDVNGAANALFYLSDAASMTVKIGPNATITGATAFFSYAASNGRPNLTIEGTVTGAIKLQAGADITLKGTPTVGNLILPANGVVDATGMTGGNVAVTAADGVISTEFGTKEAAEAVADYFSIYGGSDTKEVFANDDKKLELGVKPVEVIPGAKGDYDDALDFGTDGLAWCPVCEDYFEWIPITDAEVDASTNGYVLGNGGLAADAHKHYYLTGNLTSNGKNCVRTTWNAFGTMCLHLNGFNMTSETAHPTVINAYDGTVNIMGSGVVTGGTGPALQAEDTNKAAQGAAYAGMGAINVYSGKFTKVSTNTTTPIVKLAASGGNINIYGGQIGEENATLTGGSAAVEIDGKDDVATFRLYGGTIYGVEGSTASAIYPNNGNALFEMYGGSIVSSTPSKHMIVVNLGAVDIKSTAVLDAANAKYAINIWGTATGKATVSGTVLGTVFSSSTVDGSITLSGTPSITKLHAASCKVDATAMTGLKTGSAKILLTASGSKVTFKDADTATAALEWFAYDGTDRILSVSGNSLITSEAQGNETSVTERLDFVGNKAYCPVCGDYFDWEVTSGGTISKGGHYYLNTSITSAITVSTTDKVCLHLNGNDVTAASAAAITVSGACSGLHIMGTADSAVSGKAGGWEGSALNVKANATVYMYAGTYTKNAADVDGPIVELTGAGGTVYMYNPVVIDARNLSASNLSPALAIRGASATPGKFVMEGGTIYGGTQTHGGPRKSAAVTVYDAYSTFQMKGGDLYAGNVTKDNLNADAISFQTGGTLIIEDGATVHAGTGYSIVVDIAADVSIAGTVAGTVYITNNGKNANMTLSGAAKVGKLSIPAGMLIEVSDLSEGADVKVDAFGTFTKAISTDAEAIVNNEWITSAYPTYEDVAADVATLKINYIGSTDATDTLTFYDGINKAYCSGCGKLACWTALSKTGETTYFADGDHYYVPAGGFAHAGTGRVIGITTAGRVGCLHMNGENITTTNNAGGILVSGAGTTLNIMGQGTITGSGQYTYTGAALQVQTESACNLYGKVTLTKTDTVAPVVLLLTGGHLTMNDEVVIGATGLTYGAAAAVSIRAINGNVNIGSTLTVKGGTINGGNASNGASAIFFVDTASGDLNTLDMQGGELVGDPSSTDDSTIYAAGAFNLYIGEDAEVGATGAGKSFDSAWVSNATQMTIAGTVNGSVDCTDFTANVQGQPKLVGTAKVAELILDNNNTVDATELAEGAEIYINLDGVDKDPHVTNIFTSKFESDDAADAVKNCFKPMVDGVYYEGVYGVVVTPANELKVEFILSKEAKIVWTDTAASKGFCPVCQKVVTWTALNATTRNYIGDGTHFYVPTTNFTGTTNSAENNHVIQHTTENGIGCLHMNGNNLSTTSFGETPVKAISVSKAGAVLNIMGTGTISGTGPAYYSGAALAISNGAKVNIYGKVTLTKVNDEITPIVFINNGQLDIYDRVTIDGRNLKTKNAMSAMISLYAATSAFNMHGGTYYAGILEATETSASNLMYLAEGSTFNMQGGTIYAGQSAGVNGGNANLVISGGNVTIGENALITGSTTGYILNQWDGTGTLTISGHIEGKVQSSQAKDGQFILSGTPEITSLNMAGSNSKVDVSGMTGGNVGLSVASNNLRVFTTEITTGTPATIAGYFTYVGETEEFLVIAAEGNYLAVSKASFVVIDASGNEVPVNTVAAAIEYVTTNPGSYIKVTDTVALTLKGEEITLDMNGNTASVSGEGVVTAFDSTTDGFGKTTAGILTAGELVDVKQDVTVNGNRYLYIMHGEGNYSFHRVIIKLTQIVLNTRNSALYYKAQFQSDETLADRVIDFGISYSLYDADKGVGGMPSASNPIASQIDVPMAGEFTGNNAASTSYISDIVTEGSADNATSVEMKICANPFLQVDVTGNDGVQGFGQYSSEDTGKAKSMKDILDYYESDMNNSYTGLSEARKNELDKFYKTMFTDNKIDLGYSLIGSTYVPTSVSNDEEEEG